VIHSQVPRITSSRIVMYSLNYADRLQRALPYVPYSAERGLCHLAELADPTTNVLTLALKPVDPRVFDYHLDHLRGSGTVTDAHAGHRASLLVPADEGVPRLDARVLADPAVMDRLRQEVASVADVSIVNFAASPAAEKLAAVLGVPLQEGGYDLAVTWGGKVGGKEVLRRGGVMSPNSWAESLRGEEDLLTAVRALAGGPTRPRRVLLKLNDPSWGGSVGNCLLDCDRLLAGDVNGSVEIGYQAWPLLMEELATGGGIVEEFIDGVVASPSGTGQVGPDGTVRVVATHDQIIKAGQYWGCVFPAGDAWRAEVVSSVQRVGDVLNALGFRGTFGVDFVVSADGQLAAVEINLRKVGSSHVVATVEALTGARVGADGQLHSAMGDVHYVHRRLYQPDVLRGHDPLEMVARLERKSLLYDAERGSGVVFHMLGAIPECGYVEVTNIARSAAEARSVDEEVSAEVLSATTGSAVH
jgi:hypothetical protein